MSLNIFRTKYCYGRTTDRILSTREDDQTSKSWSVEKVMGLVSTEILRYDNRQRKLH